MRFTGLVVFLLIAVGGGLISAGISTPDEWFAGLIKPAINPPGWVFAPVWIAIYGLIAIAGSRVWASELSLPVQFWFTQMVLNFLWSPIFFALHRPDIAFLIIMVLLMTIVGFIITTWRGDRISALLFLPYAAWVSFAAVLNYQFWQLNH